MWRHVSLVSLIVLLAACGSSPKTEFYVLNADFESIAQTANANTGPERDRVHRELTDGVLMVEAGDSRRLALDGVTRFERFGPPAAV